MKKILEFINSQNKKVLIQFNEENEKTYINNKIIKDEKNTPYFIVESLENYKKIIFIDDELKNYLETYENIKF